MCVYVCMYDLCGCVGQVDSLRKVWRGVNNLNFNCDCFYVLTIIASNNFH